MDTQARARVVSVNVGGVREVTYRGKPRTTAIWKDPVEGPVGVSNAGVVGDRQADPTAHGGPRKAVYLYGTDDLAWWEAELGERVGPGTFGENLTVAGVVINDARIGEQWRVGSALLEVTQPRFPCWKLGFRMGDPRFPKRFLEAGRAGTYVTVLSEGAVQAGDAIEVVTRPTHPVTVGLVAHLNHADRELALLLLQAAEAGISLDEWQDLLGQAGVG
ncbi:MAG TPA: MOSC domain-containing protein [Actinomycetota bacterium]|nr:MOSC domain-containing protein [Actinomycetota bacterium]